MRTALSADATVVDLHRNGPYYYAVGVSLLQFDLPERGDLAKTLVEVRGQLGMVCSGGRALFADFREEVSLRDGLCPQCSSGGHLKNDSSFG